MSWLFTLCSFVCDIWNVLLGGCSILWLLVAHSGSSPSAVAVGSLIESVFVSQQESQRSGDVLEIMSERGGGKELGGLRVHTKKQDP